MLQAFSISLCSSEDRLGPCSREPILYEESVSPKENERQKSSDTKSTARKKSRARSFARIR